MGAPTVRKYMNLAIYLLTLFEKHGDPVKVAFGDGTEIDDFSDETLDSLKVQKMSEKRELRKS